MSFFVKLVSHISLSSSFSLLFFLCLFLSHLVPLVMPANLEVTPSSYSTLRVSWGAAPGATQYMILHSALNHGEPEDAKEVRNASLFLCELCVFGSDVIYNYKQINPSLPKTRVISRQRRTSATGKQAGEIVM